MDPVALRIFGIEIMWYGVLIAFAMLTGTILAIMEARRVGFDENHILDIILYSVPSAIIGARLYYVVFQWQEYRNNLLQILDIRSGGLAIHGGIIGGMIAAYIYTRIKNISFLKVADICIPSIILGQAIGRWGNFFNQEAYGGVVSSEFISKFPRFIREQMYIGGEYHHPTFLYESIWNLGVFILLVTLRKKQRRNGYILSAYLIFYSIGRFFIEGLRTDSLMIGSLRQAQLISIVMLAVGIAGILWIIRKDR